MKIKNSIAAWAISTALTLPAFGQFGQNIGLRPELMGSQRYNPAYMLDGEFTKFRYGAAFDAWLGNSDVALKGVFDTDGYITHETRDRIIGDIKGSASLSAGYDFDILNVNLKVGETPLAIYASDRVYAGLQTGGWGTTGLIFKGNGYYAGDTVSDDALSFDLFHTRELGVGGGKSFADGKLKAAGRVGLVLGQSMRSLRDGSYSLYTSPNGTQLNIQGTYDFSQSQQTDSLPFISGQGIGFAVDLGMTYELNDRMRLEFSVLDAGMTSWKVKNYTHTVDVDFEGIDISSLFADSLSEQLADAADSLLGLLLPDSVLENRAVSAPTIFRAGFAMKIGEKGQLLGSLAYSPTANGPYTRIPLISGAYAHEVVSGLKVSGNAYFGGVDMFGVGAMASYRLGLSGDKMGIELAVGSDNLLGLLVGSAGRGMAGFGSIGFTY